MDDVWDATTEIGNRFWVKKSDCPCWLTRPKTTSLEQRVKGVRCCSSCQWSERHPSHAVHQTPRPDISQGQACKMWSLMPIGACMQGTCTHERRAASKGRVLDLCTHLFPFRWWSRSQSCTHGNQWGSFSFVWLGRWWNVCQVEERRPGAGLAVCDVGRAGECLDCAFPHLWSYLLIHAPHPPVLLHVLSCDSSPRAGRIL